MAQQNDNPDFVQSTSAESSGNPTGDRPRRRGFWSNVKELAQEEVQRLNENVNTELERRGMSDTADAARQNLQRAGDVLTGADLRKFDEFTEAVTRVCVGLHRDNLELKEQVARLEQQLEESTLAQKDLAARLDVLEKGED